MVNWLNPLMSLVHGIVKMAGLCQQTVDIEPGTTMTFWVPKERHNQAHYEGVDNHKNAANVENKKPVVVLMQGFVTDGILNWLPQVRALTSKYSVYVPDLLFFGGSATRSTDRSLAFQAECITKALGKLGVSRCTVVGFSYGGMVGFKMAESRPDLVHSLVISGAIFDWTESTSTATLKRLGVASLSELLLPESIGGLKALLSVGIYRKMWFPDFLFRYFLKVMLNNRNERAELLDGLLIRNEDAKVPNIKQRVLLLWGENDDMTKLEVAKNMSEQLGDRTKLQEIKKAGHLVQLERPFLYNQHLKEFLAIVHTELETTSKNN